ncbi:MAG: DNA-binding protein [Bacteroidales bacterium]|nr:DNA-binding protein [Bacteroidales bacterium]MBN2817438.1 DNA-binding protein [Bacteroidales bacterium]
MIYTEAKQGRVFILRLEDGEIMQDVIEEFAERTGIQRAYIQAVGGADKGSILITGPEESRSQKIVPIHSILNDMHETFGFGTIFPKKNGKPSLYMHISCGREDNTITGEIRNGVKVWHVIEVIIIELLENNSTRLADSKTGFDLLIPS